MITLANEIIRLRALKKNIYATFLTLKESAILKNFLIYSGGSILLRSISIVLAPITFAILSPADYGLLSLITSFNNVLVVILSFGLRQVFFLEFYHCDNASRKIIVNDIICIYLIASVPFFFIALWQSALINSYFFMNHASMTLIMLMLLYCFSYFFAELFYQNLQYRTKAIQLTALQTSAALITIACNLTFLCIYGWGVFGMMLGYTIGMLFVCCIGLGAYISKGCFATFNIKKSLPKFSYYMKLGLPFIPGVLFGWILACGNRWILAWYGTLHDVGIYSLADMFGSLFHMLILYPMSGSYLPYLFQKFSEHKHDLAPIESWNRKNMYMSMLAATVLMSLGYYIGKPIIYLLLPSKYHESIRYIWFILIGNVFLMGTYFASSLIQFHKKSYFLALSMCISALLNIGLNIILIPLLNMYGCVIATVSAYAFYFGITLWYNNRLLNQHNQLIASESHQTFS